MSPTSRPERTDGVIAVLIMGISLTAALFAYLDSQAGNRAAVSNRRSEAAAVDVMLNATSGESEIAQQYVVYGYGNDTGWISRSLADDGSEFSDALAGAYAAATGQTETFSDLIDSVYQDSIGAIDFVRFEQETRRPAYRAAELQEAHAEVAGRWGAKAAAYLAVVTVLAAAVFLLGITATVARDTRTILVGTGVGLAVTAALWGLAVSLRPIPPVSERAIDAYLDGAISQSLATTTDQLYFAERRLGEAIEANPRYRRAYVVRGIARHQLDLSDPDGPQGSVSAVADFETALRLDDRDAVAWSDLGGALFWLQEYPEAERALRRSLAIDPANPLTNLNLALILAVTGDPAYEDQMAVVDAVLAELPSWERDGIVSGYYPVLDLAETYRPDVSSAVDGFHQWLLQVERQISVGRRFFGSPTPGVTVAIFDAPDLSLSSEGTSLLVTFEFSGVGRGERFIYRTAVDGVEAEGLSLTAAISWPWETPGGSASLVLNDDAGFRGHTVRVELYLEGNLLALGEFSG
jgi:tetratricopeptide (TPR) repeat protein